MCVGDGKAGGLNHANHQQQAGKQTGLHGGSVGDDPRKCGLKVIFSLIFSYFY
jgi:hypothetical protein